MATTENEKKFVIKHTFDSPLNMVDGDIAESPIENHFGVPWRIRITKFVNCGECFLECPVTSEFTDWSIDFKFKGTLLLNKEMRSCLGSKVQCLPNKTSHYFFIFSNDSIPSFLIDGRLPIKFDVEITGMTGNFGKKKLRSFDDDAAKTFSDVVLTVGDQKFYVNKTYLAFHSKYFEALLLGNFSESEKAEIELKGIDPNAFQDYLELICGEILVNDTSVLGILHLADFFDSKTAIRRCADFLFEKSNLPLKDKFHAAIKYNLDELKEKCLSEMRTPADFMSVVPDVSNEFDTDVWKELFMKYTAQFK